MNPIIDNVDIHELIPVLAIILGFVIVFIAVAGGLMIALVKAWRGGHKVATRKIDAEEALAFQELQRGFQRMENRVESLETLLIERASIDRPARIKN